MTKHIFVTGGVVSGLGKGITAASVGRLLKMRGLKVASQKFDPYINVDPGTMSPFQHGEVFVTEDGAETDLDLGHYERFTDTAMSRLNSVTTGSDNGTMCFFACLVPTASLVQTPLVRSRSAHFIAKTSEPLRAPVSISSLTMSVNCLSG